MVAARDRFVHRDRCNRRSIQLIVRDTIGVRPSPVKRRIYDQHDPQRSRLRPCVHRVPADRSVRPLLPQFPKANEISESNLQSALTNRAPAEASRGAGGNKSLPAFFSACDSRVSTRQLPSIDAQTEARAAFRALPWTHARTHAREPTLAVFQVVPPKTSRGSAPSGTLGKLTRKGRNPCQI